VGSDQRLVATEHPNTPGGQDTTKPSFLPELREYWLNRTGQVVFGITVVLAVAIVVVMTQLSMVARVGDFSAGLWTSPEAQVGAALVLALIAFFAGLFWPTAYLPTLWAIAPLVPGLASISIVATYFVGPEHQGPVAFIVGCEIAAAIVVVSAIPLRIIASVRVAQTRSYWELRRRSDQLRDRLETVGNPAESKAMQQTAGDELMVRKMAWTEAMKQLHEVDEALGTPPSKSRTNGLEWVSAMGYVSLWRRVDRAEEALIELEPLDLVLSDALHDKLRLSGARIKIDHLMPALSTAVKAISPDAYTEYFVDQKKGDPNDPGPGNHGAIKAPTEHSMRLGRAMLREVRNATNNYFEDAMEGIVRARNRLWRAILLTATVTFLLVGLAVISNVPRTQLIAASVFFVVGAIVGLFNLLRLQAKSDTAVEDFNLFEARLVHTPLISGLAGVAGVVLAAFAATSSTATSLTAVFDLDQNHIGLIIAAAFGLAPDRVIAPLLNQTEQLKGQLKAGKAAVAKRPKKRGTATTATSQGSP